MSRVNIPDDDEVDEATQAADWQEFILSLPRSTALGLAGCPAGFVVPDGVDDLTAYRLAYVAAVEARKARTKAKAETERLAAEAAVSAKAAEEMRFADLVATRLRGGGADQDTSGSRPRLPLKTSYTLSKLSSGETAIKMMAVASDRKLSVEKRQRLIYQLDSRVLGYKGEQWAGLLGCSARAARKTKWWTKDRPILLHDE